MIILLVLVGLQTVLVYSANILGIIPTASYSHQVPFQPLWRELSLRGHLVTVITTHPVKDTSLVNLTEIDISYVREVYKKYKFANVASDKSKSFLEIADIMITMLEEADEAQLSSSEIQNLINNNSIHFDLVMVEAQLPGMMAFSWRFNAPMIGIASLDAGVQYHRYMGNPNHPVVNPNTNLPVVDSEHLSFKERLSSLIYDFFYQYVFMYKKTEPRSHKLFKRFFGEGLPSFSDLYKNMVMLFVNTNPIFHNVRPLNPSTIAIGGSLHIKKPQPLPKELQEYLDNSKVGVIYFSLGSNVPGHQSRHILEQIFPAFSQLPYTFLVKTDVELEDIPKNVKIDKWFPQQDLLRHPNIKLFITQGGLQSLQEAILNGIPLIGIPFFGDQLSNVNRMVIKRYGIKLDNSNITKESITEAISEVINNPIYRQMARQMGDILKDEEVPSLQKAVWWTEYVIRHKGAHHLKSPMVDLPLWKFYMLDVIGFIAINFFIFIFVILKVFKFLFSVLKPSDKTKIKDE